MVFIFAKIQAIFKANVDGDEEENANTIAEVIKFVANKFLYSNTEQKEVLIDPIVKLMLGILMGMHERKIDRTKSILTIINATGDALYTIIITGDQALAKEYVGRSLNDMQKQMLQNIIKAIASTKSQQVQQKPIQSQKPGTTSGPKFKENQSKIKLATKIAK